jgi:hypothetical protein
VASDLRSIQALTLQSSIRILRLFLTLIMRPNPNLIGFHLRLILLFSQKESKGSFYNRFWITLRFRIGFTLDFTPGPNQDLKVIYKRTKVDPNPNHNPSNPPLQSKRKRMMFL